MLHLTRQVDAEQAGTISRAWNPQIVCWWIVRVLGIQT